MTIAIILVGGYGSRFGFLTQKTPKALMEISDGVTLLDRQLEQLKAAGIKKVHLATGHLGEKIRARYKDRWKGMAIHYTVETTPKGNLWAVRENLKGVKEDVVLLNGDWVSSVDIGAFIKHSQKSIYPICIFLTKIKSHYGIVRFNDERVTEFVEKPFLDQYINGGLYYLKPAIFPYLEMDYNGKNIEETVFPLVTGKGLLGHYLDNSAFHVSVDTVKDLKDARKTLGENGDN